MRTFINPIKKVLVLSLMVLIITILNTGCHKNEYPCPGLGKSSEADLSKFDENGKLKDDKNGNRRINKTSGLVNKKSPKKLRAPRKTHL
jgi:hypothetical protein